MTVLPTKSICLN